MSKRPAFGYVEIDDADMEHTHLWVTANGADGRVIEIIEQYPIENRISAYAMARRLAKLLDLPLKLLKDPGGEARPISPSDFPDTAMYDELKKLQELIEHSLARLDTVRRGSPEYRPIVRQLDGLRDRVSLLTGVD
jgi:hypothetical protein